MHDPAFIGCRTVKGDCPALEEYLSLPGARPADRCWVLGIRLLGTCRSDSKLRLLLTDSKERRPVLARLGMLCRISSSLLAYLSRSCIGICTDLLGGRIREVDDLL